MLFLYLDLGFGMTTPKTLPGKFMLIIYGFFGCSGGILFFNLFLERIITILAYIMRYFHEREAKRNAVNERRESAVSLDDNLENWKPSVYGVMVCLMAYLFYSSLIQSCIQVCLLCLTVIVGSSAAAAFASMENWTYTESIYFCFVAFSTIGFGDFVTNQKPIYRFEELYRVVNFLFLVVGCSCIYSLFNVTSIVIKEFLNWLIKKLDFKCTCCRTKKSPVLTQVARSRRNALTPHHVKSYSSHQRGVSVKASIAEATSEADADSNYDSENDEGRNSNEMICIRDFKSNKVSLAILQVEKTKFLEQLT